MDELIELMRVFERLDNNASDLDWALQLALLMGQFIKLIQESSITDQSTTEFQELLTVTVSNLKEKINEYVLMVMQAEIERMRNGEN